MIFGLLYYIFHNILYKGYLVVLLYKSLDWFISYVRLAVGWLIGRSVGRSVIISQKGGKLYFHALQSEHLFDHERAVSANDINQITDRC